MDINIVESILTENIGKYESSLVQIKHCLSFYENYYNQIIEKISKCKNIDEANDLFETIQNSNHILYLIKYKYEIKISEFLENILRNFDTIDSIEFEIKNYLFQRIKENYRFLD